MAVEADHLLGIWRDTPLEDLATEAGARKVRGPARCDFREADAPRSTAAPMPRTGAMRTLRVIYNWALERGHVRPNPDGWHPTRQVTYNPEEQNGEKKAMDLSDLAAWWQAYLAMENRVRAEISAIPAAVRQPVGGHCDGTLGASRRGRAAAAHPDAQRRQGPCL